MTTMTETVGQMVTERPSRARIFDETGIDYCGSAQQTLAEACRRRGVDVDSVLDRLMELDQKEDSAVRNWSEVPLGDLCDCIESVFHASLRRELPRIGMLLYHVAEGYAAGHPELNRVLELFSLFSGDLKLHMTKEEDVLFPLVKAVEAGDADTVEPIHTIMQLEVEHDEAMRRLNEIRQVTHDYRPPSDACGTYKAALDGLRNLEDDLREHLGIENNVLFPRVCQLDFVKEM